ncbi:MAG: DUF4824 family protein [Candidatus Solibacter usitatus]|nr:DUF4824 family protein [Candidatus Solibacter usitatus]
MKHLLLLAAAAVVLVANGLALVHAVRNRTGVPEAEITLTDNEFNYSRNPDDSGVTLKMNLGGSKYWREPGAFSPTHLAALGFDVSKPPSDKDAEVFYRRQRPRTGFIAIGFEGDPALFTVINSSKDAAALRARYPDRKRVAVVPAAVRLFHYPALKLPSEPERPAFVGGHVIQFPSAIHVPKPFSDGFRALPATERPEGSEVPLYRITLTYGRSLEPWVTKVEFPAQPGPR